MSNFTLSHLQIQTCEIASLLKSLDYAMTYVSESGFEIQYIPVFYDHLVLIEEKVDSLMKRIDLMELNEK